MKIIEKHFLIISILLTTSTTLDAQTITSIVPDNAQQGESLSVTITGQNTHFLQGSPTDNIVWFSQGSPTIYASSSLAYSNTSLSASFNIPIDASTGSRDVHVQNPTDGTLTLTDGFTINPADPAPAAPTLLLPSHGATVNDYTPTFDWDDPTYAYRYHLLVDDNSGFSSPEIEQTNLSSSTYTPSGSNPMTNGLYYWKVKAKNSSNIWGDWSPIWSFTVNAVPSITSISPDSAKQGQSLSVTISGQNTHFLQGSPTDHIVWFSQGSPTIYASSSWANSNTSLPASFDIPIGASVGSRDVHVQNPTDGTLTLTDGFTINPADPAPDAPTLFLPANGTTVNDYTPTFDWDDPTYAYRYHLIVDDNSGFSSPEIEQTNLSSSTYTPSMANGLYYWKVRAKNISNIWGDWSPIWSFTVNAVPSITSINPDNAEQGQSLSVTITGQNTHFLQGSPTDNIVWFSQGSPTIYASSSWANSNTSLSASFNIPIDASTGSRDVHVQNPTDGTLTLTNGFTITGPVLNSINPDNARQGHQGLSVTITGQGTHFQQGSGTTGVWFSQGSPTVNINATSFSASSNTSLNADFDIPGDAAIGTWDVHVEDDVDGTLTLSDGFTILVPEPLNLYVDNDAPSDPGPNNPDVSDPNENGSPEHPFDAIQEAIDVAIDDDTVIVLEGTYTGNGNRDIDFLGKAITVRSENGPESCIIDCNQQGRGFYFHSGEDANSVLDGFTITNGYTYDGGGGIYCNSSSPTITNCAFSGNTSYGMGGGMSCSAISGPTVNNCSFIGNQGGSGGGGIGCEGSNLTITNCSFIGNSAYYYYGGAMHFHQSDASLTNCLIMGNYAHDVTAGGGGISCYGQNSFLTITNCTVAGNVAEQRGGGISCRGSSIVIRSSILWDNRGRSFGDSIYIGEAHPDLPGAIDVSYSNLENGQSGIYAALGSTVDWGSGNIDVDPLFVNPGYWDWGEWVDGDYHLQADSLCIDAGDPNYSTDANDFDIGGNRRVYGGRVDMGAYEYCPEKIWDLNNDGIVNFGDFVILALYWKDYTCLWPDWCQGCDADESGAVDYNDLALFSEHWLDEYPVKFFSASLDTDPNWTTTGEWAFGLPTGGGGIQYGNPDPTSGYTGINVYGVNLNGDYSTAAGGPYYLTAGPFDCNDYNNVTLKFARWLNTDDPAYVESTIGVFTDLMGFSVWEHTSRSDLTDSSWRIVEYDISSMADGQEAVYIRWGYEVLEYAYPYSGWNIDDIELWGNPM